MATQEIRPIRIDGNVAYVPLTNGYVAVIDAGDVDLVAGVNWFAQIARRRDGSVRTIYAVRTDRGHGQKTIRMHRLIAGSAWEAETDHRDGDGLNNRRGNLRPASTAQNQHNRRKNKDSLSPVKGAVWHKASGKWQARIRSGGKRIYLGLFEDLEMATLAVADARKMLHGEFGRIA